MLLLEATEIDVVSEEENKVDDQDSTITKAAMTCSEQGKVQMQSRNVIVEQPIR